MVEVLPTRRWTAWWLALPSQAPERIKWRKTFAQKALSIQKTAYPFE
jgi:hypothetical protein